MENVLAHVGTDIAHGVEKVGSVLKDTVTVGEKVIKIIEDGAKLTPEVKSAIAAIINAGKDVAVAAAPALLTGGTNLAGDLAALPAVIAAVVHLVSVIEQQEPVFADVAKVVKADINYH